MGASRLLTSNIRQRLAVSVLLEWGQSVVHTSAIQSLRAVFCLRLTESQITLLAMAIAMIPHPAPIPIPMTRPDPDPLPASPLLSTVVPVVAVTAVAELTTSVPVVEATVKTGDEEIAANVVAADVFATATALDVVEALGV
jgi:hypothetical protein